MRGPRWHSFRPVCYWWVALLLHVDYVNRIAEAVHGCSVFFLPDFKWKKAICDSESARLRHIPMDLPANLVELHVKHQHIPFLTDQGLALLHHLEILQIESCEVSRITPDAFRSLSKLKNLSLRNNSLHLGYDSFPKELLQSLPNLRLLNLAHNPIELVPDSFFSITSGSILHSLWLGPTKGSALYIESNAFSGLPHLHLLDLSFSRLSSLPQVTERALSEMDELTELYLGGNPWHCDCKLRWIHVWFSRHSRPTFRFTQKYTNQLGVQMVVQPTCLTPSNLNNRPIFSEKLTSMEFRCVPKMLTENQNLSIPVGGAVLLTCEFYADPVTPVTWYKDGHVVFNSSRYQIKQHMTSETHVTSLQTTISGSNDGGVWTCVLDDDVTLVSATFNVIVTPGTSGILSAMNVSQQHWIYAGIGVSLLFVLLTIIGIGIFYCCDPRFHSDQASQSLVGKRRASRLKQCCSRAKLSDVSSGKNQNNSGADKKDNKSNGDAGRSRSNSSSPHSCLLKPTRIPLVNAETSVTNSDFSVRDVVQPVGQAAAEQMSVNTNRLLVSCDGTEPGIMLATRIPEVSAFESPSSVYGIPNIMDYQVSPTITSNPNETGLPPINYIAHSTFSGQLLKPSIPSSQIYARVAPLTSFHDTAHFQQLSSIQRTAFTSPCPVHGAVNIDRLKLSSSVTDEAHFINQSDQKSFVIVATTNGSEPSEYQSKTMHSLVRNQQPTRKNELTENTFSNIMECTGPLSITTSQEDETALKLGYTKRVIATGFQKLAGKSNPVSSSSSIALQQKRYAESHGESTTSESPNSISNTNQRSGKYAFYGPAYAVKLAAPQYLSRHTAPCANLITGAGTVTFSDGTKPLLKRTNESLSSSCSDETYDCSHVSNSSNSSSPNQLLPRSPPFETCGRFASSPSHSLRLERREPLCALHFPSWRGYTSQVISPSVNAPRYVFYPGAATLPSKLRTSKQRHSLPFLGTPYRNSCKSLNISRSQIPVRPGSKHKLDTDSGTDYND
ncbi:unnamed protein product [Dicrocoelium dendriticum]|nr:unnamed protein product [Dicrocoelium dendriticum]